MTPQIPEIVAILLAGGLGLRFQSAAPAERKLHAVIQTGTLKGQVVGLASAAHLCAGLAPFHAQVIVAARAVDTATQHLFRDYPIVPCDRASEGMGATLAQSIAQAPTPTAGYIVALADMPYVTARSVTKLASALCQSQQDKMSGIYCLQTPSGQRGNPVAFAVRYRSSLMQLQGDIGARQLVRTAQDCVFITVQDAGILRDIDTPADL